MKISKSMELRRNKQIFGIIIFLVVLFQTCKIYCGIAIDTRFESAVPSQQNQAFVFQNTQTFSSTHDYAIGNIEFRNGVQPSAYNQTLTLGVTPKFTGPLGIGPHQTGHNYSNANYNILSDLTLEGSFFQPANNASLAALGVNFTNLSTSTMFLQSDFVITNTLAFNIGLHPNFPTNNVCPTIDGLGNKFVFPVAGSIFMYATGTFRHITLKTQSVTSIIQQYGGPLTFHDVEIVATIGSTSFMPPQISFSGQKNVLGYGGTIILGGGPTNIASQSTLTVTPGTTMTFGPTFNPFFSPPLAFTDSTSVLYLDNCTVDFSPQSSTVPTAETFIMTKGTIYVSGNVTLASLNGLGTYQFGDGVNQSNNMNIVILPGSKLILGTGVKLIYANV